MTRDIENLDDIKTLVDQFYGKVRQDELIGPIFNGIIRDRWPEHLDKMYRFWQTILLGEHTYRGYPFKPHAGLLVSKKHFDRWLNLFFATLDEYFIGEKVIAAKRQAHKMAQMFLLKIEHLRQQSVDAL